MVKKAQTASNPSGEEKTKLAELKELAQTTMDEETRNKLGLDREIKPGERIIKRAKITNGDTLECEYVVNGDTVSIKKKALIHNDLKNAFEELVPHFAMLCDLKEFKKLAQFFDDCTIIGRANLRVTAFSFGSTVPASGVILSGIKQINNNRQITINSPYTEFESEVNVYDFSGLLAKAVNVAADEVLLYLDGKHAEPEPEIALDGEEGYNNK